MSLLVLCSAVALGQRGPGGGGPPGGGPGGPGGGPGGGMGGPGGGAMGERLGAGRGDIAPPKRNGPGLGLASRWWDDKHTAKVINLRNDQQKRMDDIYNANKGTLYNLKDNLDRAEQQLGSMSRQDLQDETKVFAAIDRVSQARAELEKESAHIQLQLRKELDADQVAALDREMAPR